MTIEKIKFISRSREHVDIIIIIFLYQTNTRLRVGFGLVRLRLMSLMGQASSNFPQVQLCVARELTQLTYKLHPCILCCWSITWFHLGWLSASLLSAQQQYILQVVDPKFCSLLLSDSPISLVLHWTIQLNQESGLMCFIYIIGKHLSLPLFSGMFLSIRSGFEYF